MFMSDNDRSLLAATEDNKVLKWDIETNTIIQSMTWADKIPVKGYSVATAPLFAVFSAELHVLGIVYRGRPVVLWDVRNGAFIGVCGKISAANDRRRFTTTTVQSMVFGPASGTSLLTVSYQDEDLILFEPMKNKLIKSVTAGVQCLACSADGRTLLGGDT